MNPPLSPPPNMLKTPAGLTRIESPTNRTFGYMVRLKRGGRVVNEFFSDKKHGGKRRAKAAAAARYGELRAEAPPANTSHKGVLTSRNTSGKVGVRIAVHSGRPGSDSEYCSWAASWVTPDGRQRTAVFSWSKFGYEVALALAGLARDHETADREQIFALYREQTGQRVEDARDAG